MAKKKINQLPDAIEPIDFTESYLVLDQYDTDTEEFKTVKVKADSFTPGAPSNIYTADGTLVNDRTVTLDDNSLVFENENGLIIDNIDKIDFNNNTLGLYKNTNITPSIGSVTNASYESFSPTSSPIASFNNLTQSATSGVGVDIMFTINVYNQKGIHYVMDIENGGTGYKIGDTITLDGDDIVAPGDIVYTVISIDDDKIIGNAIVLDDNNISIKSTSKDIDDIESGVVANFNSNGMSLDYHKDIIDNAPTSSLKFSVGFNGIEYNVNNQRSTIEFNSNDRIIINPKNGNISKKCISTNDETIDDTTTTIFSSGTLLPADIYHINAVVFAYNDDLSKVYNAELTFVSKLYDGEISLIGTVDKTEKSEFDTVTVDVELDLVNNHIWIQVIGETATYIYWETYIEIISKKI